MDSVVGSASNDTIQGVIDTNSGSLSTSDSINGGAGIDTLSLRVTDIATAATSAPSLTAIEVFTIDNDDITGEWNLNTGSVAGITNINSSGSSAGSLTNVNGVAAAAAVGLTSAKGVFAVDFAASVYATTADAITVSLNAAGDAAASGAAATLVLDGSVTGGTTGLTSGNTLESITITSSTNASRVDLVGGSAVKTLNISGNANLFLSDTVNTFSAVTTVNASTFTGALDIDLSSNTASVALTTSTGSDRIKLGAVATSLTTDDTISLGAGTDIAAVSNTNFTSAEITLIKAELTTAEVLEMYSTLSSATYSFSDLSIINNLLFTGTNVGASGAMGADAGGDGGNGGAVITLTGSEAGDSVTFSANTTGGVGGTAGTAASAGQGGAAVTITPNVDGGSDSITITLTGGITVAGGAGGGVIVASSTSATSGLGGNAIAASSHEVVNIVSTGSSANTIAGGAAGGTGGSGVATALAAGSSIVVNTNGTINVTGTADINIGTVSGTNLTVNASSFTAKLTVKGEAGNNTIVGGSAVDTINGGAGIDTLTGNGGADVFRFQLGSIHTDSESNFQSLGATGSAGSVQLNTDSITDYVKGTDAISIFLAAGTAATMSAADIVTNATSSTGAASISSAGIATFATADDTLAERIFAVETAINAGGTAAAEQFAVFEHSTNTYVFVSDGSDGMTDGDLMIKLTGVTGITAVSYSSGNMVLS